jgi:hypothetical protein
LNGTAVSQDAQAVNTVQTCLITTPSVPAAAGESSDETNYFF